MLPFIHIASLQIPTFFLVISLTVLCSLSLFYSALNSKRFALLSRAGFVPSDGIDLSLILMVSGFLGARLMHVFYELPEFYFANPKMILAFWQGGFVFYGGFLLALLGGFAWLKIRIRRFKRKPSFTKSFFQWADLLAPAVSLSYLLGRFGCLLEGCCYGRFTEVPWAIALRHPTPLYASLMEAINFLVLFFISRKKDLFLKEGSLFFTWLFLHSCFRMIMESFRDDFRGPTFGVLSISSLISISLAVISFLGVSFLNRQKNRA